MPRLAIAWPAWRRSIPSSCLWRWHFCPVIFPAPGQELFCVKCGAPVGIFLAHGKGYRHYRGVITATSKPRSYKADHIPVIGWRPAADAVAIRQDAI